MKKITITLAVAAAISINATAQAESTRVIVTIENLAPANGTFTTPHWVGFHDGIFDTYNGGTPASTLPILGSVAIERLAEDGNNEPLTNDFSSLVSEGVQATIPGPNGPLAPGEITSQSFVLDSNNLSQRFFSYASMVLPSNDFWYANGNPQAHPIFDENGAFIAQDFFVTQNDVLDAGTEVNDEIPANTPLLGQEVANTGIDENGVILDFGDASGLVAFRQPEDGGNILADPRFNMADFAVEGYPLVKISFSAAPAITDNLRFRAKLNGDQEMPAVDTQAFGITKLRLRNNGERLKFVSFFRGLRNVTMAHLHVGAEGTNGPVVASLLPADFNPRSREGRRANFLISGNLSNSDLVGPLAGQPLDALIAEIQAGNVYINIHTEQNPSGEIRGQL
ncbi:MAG: CHRD domain-containing protein [Thiotrichales bacterium]|nr:CHRD domain-containing protein [Thiotrichales bacterium]